MTSIKWTSRFMAQALATAQWSKDPSTKCGAIIVDDVLRVRGQG